MSTREGTRFSVDYEEFPLCACWCDQHFVRVTREMIMKGLTFPCKVKKCVTLAEEHGWNPRVEPGGLSPDQMERCYG